MSDESRPVRLSLAGICPLCGAQLDLNSAACRRCGVAPKRVGLCIHCKSTSSVRPQPELGWVCEVCGGARLAHPAFEETATVQAHLAAATKAHRGSRLLRAAAGFAAAFAGVTLLLLVALGAIFSLRATTQITIAIFPILIVVAALISFARARMLRSHIAFEIEQAQAGAMVKLLADFPQGAVAAQLASLLQISHARAEQLLTHLNVRDDIESVVAEDGQLLFRIRHGNDPVLDVFEPAAASRLRLPHELSPEEAADEQRPVQPTTDKAR
jgi:hypothetical protein